MPPLHVATKGKPAIVDARGRQVLLRGVDTNQLGDYYRVRPGLRPAPPLGKRDFTQMSHLGFDVVRLVISWSKLEPTPGAFNRSYVARIRRAVHRARRHRIYVVIDIHQDAWGKYIATPRGATCPAGTVPNQGWDGAPRWATFTDGLSTCRGSGRSSSPAVQRAWAGFWRNRNIIQQRLVTIWGRLARTFATSPAVAGYDLLNEPDPGDARSDGEPAILARYYANAIAAIRAGERSRRHGFRHMVFFEPTILWLGSHPANHTVPPGFTSDRDLVFAPHLYSSRRGRKPSSTQKDIVRRKYKLNSRMGRRYGFPVWVGEWGYFGDAGKERPRIADFARRQDAALWGGAWWQWKKGCGDPVNFQNGADRGPGHHVRGNLNLVKCPGGKQRHMIGSTRRILSRPYPLGAPGRLGFLRSHYDDASFELRGRDWLAGGSPWLKLWIPARGQRRPRIGGHHVSRVRLDRVVGGWIATARVHDRYRVLGHYTAPRRGGRGG